MAENKNIPLELFSDAFQIHFLRDSVWFIAREYTLKFEKNIFWLFEKFKVLINCVEVFSSRNYLSQQTLAVVNFRPHSFLQMKQSEYVQTMRTSTIDALIDTCVCLAFSGSSRGAKTEKTDTTTLFSLHT